MAIMSTLSLTLLSVHLAATAAMTGLIWFVQVVHYPLFASVGEPQFVAYEASHRWRTSLVVGPLMGLETFTALILVVSPPAGQGRTLALVGVALLAVIHASTVLLQIPRHTELSEAHDHAAIRRLVRSNWVRTVGWSARGVLAVAMLVVAAG